MTSRGALGVVLLIVGSLAASPEALAQESPTAPTEAHEGSAQDGEAEDRRLLVHIPPEEVLSTADRDAPHPLPDREDIHASLDKGLAFLLETQNEDGSWGSWGEPAHEFWSNPHTHIAWIAATTGLVLMSLLDDVSPDDVAVLEAADRAVDFLIDQSALKRPSDWDVDNTWGCIYGLSGLVEALAHPRYATSERADGIRAKCAEYLETLSNLQAPDGGWGYYDFETLAQRPSWSTSFMTAVAVLGFVRAGEVGLEVPDGMQAHAVKAVERCKLPNGAYTYSVQAIPSPGGLEWIDQLKGSLSRTQVCNLALMRAGSSKVTHEELLEGLDAFFEHHRFLDVARGKPIPHETYYYNSGYFYFFGHYYAAGVLELLTPAEQVRYRSRLAREVVKTQEQDGSMWDYYINTYHKAYGTAYSVMTLRRTLPREEFVPGG